MARRCSISGTSHQNGNRVSHANNKTHHLFHVNLQTKRIYVPELKRYVRVKLSTSTIRTIDKIGFMNTLAKNGVTLKQLGISAD